MNLSNTSFACLLCILHNMGLTVKMCFCNGGFFGFGFFRAREWYRVLRESRDLCCVIEWSLRQKWSEKRGVSLMGRHNQQPSDFMGCVQIYMHLYIHLISQAAFSAICSGFWLCWGYRLRCQACQTHSGSGCRREVWGFVSVLDSHQKGFKEMRWFHSLERCLSVLGMGRTRFSSQTWFLLVMLWLMSQNRDSPCLKSSQKRTHLVRAWVLFHVTFYTPSLKQK